MSDLPPLRPLVLSATQIETADEETDFGCLRKWWFERVAGKTFPQLPSAALGENVHNTLEHWLKKEIEQGGLHDLVIQAPGALEYLLGLRPRIRAVEKKIAIEEGFTLSGVPIVGRIDWLAQLESGGPELGDWKTTSVIGRYAKTAGQIKNSIQMNVYAAYLYGLADFDALRMTHGVFQTRGTKRFQVTSCETSKRENVSRILQIETTIDKIKKARTETDPAKVQPDTRKCHVANGCPHRAYCPISGEYNMASLLDAFKTISEAEVPKTEGQILGIATTGLATPGQVLPNDAPKSDPAMELARAGRLTIDDSKNPTGDVCAPKSEPVSTPGEVAPVVTPAPGLTPAVETPSEAPKKGGRPKGSKNKAKEFTDPVPKIEGVPQPDLTPIQQPMIVPSMPSLGPVTINKINIRHGAKVGMPNFSSATVEVEMEGTVNGSVEEARKALSLQVHDTMVKELEIYTDAKKAVEAKK